MLHTDKMLKNVFVLNIFWVQFVLLLALIVAVTSAAPSKSYQKAANKRSYYETPIIYEDVIEKKIPEVSSHNNNSCIDSGEALLIELNRFILFFKFSFKQI